MGVLAGYRAHAVAHGLSRSLMVDAAIQSAVADVGDHQNVVPRRRYEIAGTPHGEFHAIYTSSASLLQTRALA
jgi:hypothetical protein